MRPIFATLLVLTAVAAARADAAQAPTVSVTVSASAPTSSSSRSPAGQRTYTVLFRVSIGSDQECENLSVEYSYEARFDGRPSLGESASDFYDTNEPASSATFDVRASGGAGDVVAFSAQGSCEQADGTVLAQSDPVALTAAVPAHSCEQGPLRVLATRSASRQNLATPRRRVPVRAGHYLWTGYRVWVAKRGRITYGAPECHGLRETVSGASSFVPGDYSRGGDGTPLALGAGALADVRGDQHSGGVETDNAVVVSSGKRVGPSAVARFVVFTAPKKLGRITRVRVLKGRVLVAGRLGRAKLGVPLLARPGQTVVVRCTGRCTPRRVRRA